MSIVIKNKMNLADRADLENALARAENNYAVIDYLAMMCEVEIPTESDEVENEPEV